jgi:hypothetical protein
MQKRGLVPQFKVDGRQVAVKYTSPFAKSQAQEDVQALQNTIGLSQLVDPQGLALGAALKIEDIPAWVARKFGLDEKLIRNADEKKQTAETAVNMVGSAIQAGAAPQQQGA